jgi:signal transduction histidine kinase
MGTETIHVLLIEDNPFDARIITESLKNAGPEQFEVVAAARVSEIDTAVQRMGAPVDAALVDLSLPDGNGIETLQRVRAALPGIPLVVLTGLQDEATALEAMREGAQDYLVKGGRGEPARAVRYAIERQRVHDLRLAKEAAEAANRQKDLFLAMVSHELRSPLTGIRLGAELLHAGNIDPARLREVASRILECVDEQSRLVDDLLDACRLTQGTLRIEPRPMDLVEVVKSSVERVRPLAESIGVALHTDCPAGPVPVCGDAGRLRQVASNLLGNALKFTPPGGHVNVILDRCEQAARLAVVDDGRGIDPALLPHVFDRFWQAPDESESRYCRGLGLGLSIARSIVELHGGRLEAESAGPGRGATFRMKLSLALAANGP